MSFDSLIPPLGPMHYGPNDPCTFEVMNRVVPGPRQPVETATLPAASEPTYSLGQRAVREANLPAVTNAERRPGQGQQPNLPQPRERSVAFRTALGIIFNPPSNAESIRNKILNAPVRQPKD